MALIRFTLKAARRTRGGSLFHRGDAFTLPDDHPDVAALRADPAWTESRAPSAPGRKGPPAPVPAKVDAGARLYGGLVRRLHEIGGVLDGLDTEQRQALVVVVRGNLEQFIDLVGGTFGGLISAAGAGQPGLEIRKAPPELVAALERVRELEGEQADLEAELQKLGDEAVARSVKLAEALKTIGELQAQLEAARKAPPAPVAEVRIEGSTIERGSSTPPASSGPTPLQADARSDLRVALEADPAPTRAKLVDLARLAGLPVRDDLVTKTKPVVLDTLAELLAATDPPTAADLE